ncbi:hypothetical protein EVA_19516 [gut metagenome]|uniref:Uncharacterized protein n=1 Tax=gut metagenome TaxID=749906 RepID=J9FYC0_9ZZZZ
MISNNSFHWKSFAKEALFSILQKFPLEIVYHFNGF